MTVVNIKLKDGITLKALQYKIGMSFTNVKRACGGSFMNTQTGLVRIGNGDWAIEGKQGFTMVVKEKAFKEMFEVVDGHD